MCSSVESHCNEPPYNEELDITNDIFHPSNSKTNGQEPDVMNPRYNEHILPVPCHFVISVSSTVVYSLWIYSSLRKPVGGNDAFEEL